MEKKFIVWGTGQEADKLMKRLSKINSVCEEIMSEKALDVAWFLDSNIEKTKQLFYEKEVKLSKSFSQNKNHTIIVAVAKNEEILEELEQCGYSRNKEYMTIDDFYKWLWDKSRLFWRLVEALGINDNDFLTALQKHDLPEDIADKFDELLDELRLVCEKLKRMKWLSFLHEALAQTIFTVNCDWSNREIIGKKLLDILGVSGFVDCLERIYKDHITLAAKWMPQNVVKKSKRALPQTIAMYYTRYYNGGVERMLSRIIPLFIRHGYRVILFTDEIKEDMEYPLPQGVERVKLGYENGRKARCEKLIETLKRFDVDVFCGHQYGRNALYDIFCVQQVGIPFVLEMHNNFSFITDLLGGNSLELARRVDALVTLSKTDEMFWRLQGAKSVYVPNPVDAPEKEDVTPKPNTILWLQRIEQRQKQVLDLPEILKYVIELIPEARLQIVGATDDPDLEARLRKMFDELGLTQNVDFLGFHTDVAKYYRQAAVMLMTSAFEGFPMTIAESKRYGVPLVMYELPYLELLRDGKGYVSVPQRDKKAIAKALARVLKDSALREKLSKEAKESLYKFSQINLMSEWEKVWSIAVRGKDAVTLSDEEKTFSEIERLLLQLAHRTQIAGIKKEERKMEYIIYGAGQGGKAVFEKWEGVNNVYFKGFFDREKTGNYMGLPIMRYEDGDRNIPVLISLMSPFHALEVYKDLRKAGYTKLYWYRENPYADESDFQAQVEDMRNWGDAVLLQVEMHLSDRCNLNCRGCTHFSPLFHEMGFDKETALTDVRTLARNVSHIMDFYFLGGEPFLNKDIASYIRAVRSILPQTRLTVVTNGLLIPKLPDEVL
ncbi:MAG: glycosyltransferase, partial [Selenomonadaceae bacterium]|nr:glycosyltransferase [Selenomonadaceae bacterium]